MKDLEKDLRAPLGDMQQILGDLKELTNVRNRIGAHDNEFAKEFPLTMVQGIARNVLRLVDTLYCRKCQRFAEPTPREGAPVRLACRCEALFYERPRKPQADGP